MEKKRLKIFISCALGAGIGTIVALGVDQYFCWIGFFVGGLVGYLSYEFNTVIEASQKTWRKVTEWKPDKELWRLKFELAWWQFCMIITFATLTMLISFIVFCLVTPLEMIKLFLLTMIIWGMIILMFTVFIIIPNLFVESKKSYTIDEINNIKKLNPFNVYCCCLPKRFWWYLKKTPTAAIWIWYCRIAAAKFVKTVFVLIHSDIRLLCGTDAAIGAVIGYFTGNVIIGILAGGIIGVVNYELISKRFLRLERT